MSRFLWRFLCDGSCGEDVVGWFGIASAEVAVASSECLTGIKDVKIGGSLGV